MRKSKPVVLYTYVTEMYGQRVTVQRYASSTTPEQVAFEDLRLVENMHTGTAELATPTKRRSRREKSI